MAEETRIKKIILHKATDLEIHYDLPSPAGRIDRMALRSHDQADPKLYTRLQDMRVHACKLLELEKHYAANMKVTQILLDWTPEKDDDPRADPWPHVVIVAEKSIAGLDPWTIKTPATRYNGPARMNIEDLCELATAFVRGERQQLEMFKEEPLPGERQQRARRTGATVVGNIQPPVIAGVH